MPYWEWIEHLCAELLSSFNFEPSNFLLVEFHKGAAVPEALWALTSNHHRTWKIEVIFESMSENRRRGKSEKGKGKKNWKKKNQDQSQDLQKKKEKEEQDEIEEPKPRFFKAKKE